MELPNRLELKYYLYNSTQSHGFVIPIVVEYMLFRGLTFSQLGTTGAVFMAGWALGEVPTGYVSDRIGRRNGLIISSVLTVAAILILGFGRTFLAFVGAFALWSVGVTFRSGAGDAWLYEVLDERLDTEDFTRIKGRGWAARLVVTALTSILGGWLAAMNWLYPFAANAILVGLSVPVILTVPPSDRFAASEAGTPSVQAILLVIREQFTTPPLRGFIIYMALFFALVEVVTEYVQPVSTSLGVPVAALGWLYAGFSLIAAGGGYVAPTVRDHISERRWFVVGPLAVAVLLVAVAKVPVLALPAFFVLRAVRSVTTTLRSQFLNDHMGSVGRATAFSAASMMFALAAAVSRQVGGVVAELTSPLTMFGLFSAVFIAVTLFLLRVDPPIPAEVTSESAPG
jgi:MFS family permease